MPYTQKQVERGKKLVATLGKAQWDLGDLALEVCPRPSRSEANSMEYRTSPAFSDLENFAADLDITTDMLVRYRYVADVYPKNRRRSDVPIGVHRILAPLPDAVTVLHRRKMWTRPSAQEFVAQRQAANGSGAPDRTAGHVGDSSTKLSRQERVAVAREALADPDIGREVIDDNSTLADVGRRITDRTRDRTERQRLTETSAETKMRGAQEWLNTLQHGTEMLAEGRTFTRELNDFLPLTETRRDRVQQIYDNLTAMTSFLGSALTATRSMDDELASLTTDGGK